MHDRLEHIEAELERQRLALAEFNSRLTALESDEVRAGPAEAAAARDPFLAAETTPKTEIGPIVTLLGRTILALGGGYLLRAATDSGAVPLAAGTALGLFYAIVWLIAADRAARASQTASATFHGIASLAIGLPLVWEAATRFAVLPAIGAAAAVAALAAGTLWVAARHAMPVLAGCTAVATIATAVALMSATRAPAPLVLALLALNISCQRATRASRFEALRWIGAGALDLSALILMALTLGDRSPHGAIVGIGLLLLLPTVEVGTGLGGILLSRRSPDLFRWLQTAVTIALGLGGAVLITHRYATSPFLVVGVAALFTLLALWAAIVTTDEGTPLAYASWLAITCGIAVASTALDRTWFTATCVTAAIGVTWIAVRRSLALLHIQGAVLVMVAALVSGAFAATAAAWLSPGVAPSTWLDAATLLAILAAGVVAAARAPLDGALVTAAGMLSLATLTWLVAGVMVAGLNRADLGAGPQAGARTAVVALASVALAGLARRPGRTYARWLVSAALVFGAMKLVAEDLQTGDATSMFVALSLYGGALIVAPRLVRNAPSPAS